MKKHKKNISKIINKLYNHNLNKKDQEILYNIEEFYCFYNRLSENYKKALYNMFDKYFSKTEKNIKENKNLNKYF